MAVAICQRGFSHHQTYFSPSGNHPVVVVEGMFHKRICIYRKTRGMHVAVANPIMLNPADHAGKRERVIYSADAASRIRSKAWNDRHAIAVRGWLNHLIDDLARILVVPFTAELISGLCWCCPIR